MERLLDLLSDIALGAAIIVALALFYYLRAWFAVGFALVGVGFFVQAFRDDVAWPWIGGGLVIFVAAGWIAETLPETSTGRDRKKRPAGREPFADRFDGREYRPMTSAEVREAFQPFFDRLAEWRREARKIAAAEKEAERTGHVEPEKIGHARATFDRLRIEIGNLEADYGGISFAGERSTRRYEKLHDDLEDLAAGIEMSLDVMAEIRDAPHHWK